jgi:hypothetical protein
LSASPKFAPNIRFPPVGGVDLAFESSTSLALCVLVIQLATDRDSAEMATENGSHLAGGGIENVERMLKSYAQKERT